MDGGSVGANARNPDGGGLNSTPLPSPAQVAAAGMSEQDLRNLSGNTGASTKGGATPPGARPANSTDNKGTAEAGSKDVKADLQAQLTKLKAENENLASSTEIKIKEGDRKGVVSNQEIYNANFKKIYDIVEQLEIKPDMLKESKANFYADRSKNCAVIATKLQKEMEMLKSLRSFSVSQYGERDSSVRKIDTAIASRQNSIDFLKQEESVQDGKWQEAAKAMVAVGA